MRLRGGVPMVSSAVVPARAGTIRSPGVAQKGPARSNGPDDHRSGDLVVPALLATVEQDPDHVQEQDDDADDQPEVAEQRADDVDLAAGVAATFPSFCRLSSSSAVTQSVSWLAPARSAMPG